MTTIKVPAVLRSKLGDDASSDLIEMFHQHQKNQESRFVQIFKDTLSIRILESEEKMTVRMTTAIQGSEDRLNSRINDVEGKLTARIIDVEGKLTTHVNSVEGKLSAGIEKNSARIEALSTRVHEGFLNVQKQITTQTRWLIIAAAAIGTVMKTLDLVFR